MARHERHFGQVSHIPSAHNHAPGVRIAFERFHELGNLIDVLPIGCGPTAPLNTIHRAQISVLFGPFVPDGDAPLLQPYVARRSRQKPQQFLDD